MGFTLVLDDWKQGKYESQDIPEWIGKLSEPLSHKGKEDVDDFTTIIDTHVTSHGCPSMLHGAFLNAFLQIPSAPATIDAELTRYNDGLDKIFQKDTNRGAQSWISELIQNAVDVSAEKIYISIKEDSLEFSHDGSNEEDSSIFTPKQLFFLFNMNNSTKMGDFTKIGQFGVGFKYWWKFFEKVEVVVKDGQYCHNISIKGDFNTGKTIYNCEEKDDDPITSFIFSNPSDDDWADFVGDASNDIYGERVLTSLPFIQSRTGGDFTIAMKSPTTKTELFCKVKNTETVGGITLDLIEWGRKGDAADSIHNENYRVTANLVSLKGEDERAFSTFKKYVTSEYLSSQTVKSQALKESKNTEDYAKELADNSLEGAKISLLITPDIEFGYPSNLFVANSDDSKISAAFIADAPWQLNRNRVTLDMDTETPKMAWNIIVARFVDRVYSRFLKHCLGDSTNLDYTAKEMFELINRPIGHPSPLAQESYDLDAKFSTLTSATLKGTTENFGLRICHLSKSFDLSVGDDLGMASKGLADLWCKLLSSNAGYSSARKWFENALHKQLAKVKIADEIYVPVTLIINNYEEFSEKKSLPPVICRNLGNRIPKVIKDLLAKPVAGGGQPPISDEQNEMYKQQLDLFDDIIMDSSGKLSFAIDGDYNICEVTDEDHKKSMKLCLKIIETDLPNPLMHFVHKNANVTGHEMQMGRGKDSYLPGALNYQKGMQKILIESFLKSLSNPGLKDSVKFKEWLLENTSKTIWDDVVLLKEQDGEYPILTKLPPKAHMLSVVIGLKGKRHLQSIKIDSLDNSEPSANFHTETPKIFRWGDEDKEEVFISRSGMPKIEDLFQPWNDNKKYPLLPIEKSEDWAWSDLSPEGNTGWKWPQVEIHFEDSSEEKATILARMTPIFIDGLHVRKDTTNAGVYRGYREIDGQGVTREVRPGLNHSPSGPTSADTAVKVSEITSFPRNSTFSDFNLLAASIGSNDGAKYFPYWTQKQGERVWVNHSEPDTLKTHGQIRILGLMMAITEHYNTRSEDEIERLQHLYQIQSIYSSLKNHNIKYAIKSIVYDVPLLRGGSNTSKHLRNIGLAGIFIPYNKSENNNYVEDNGDIRLRESEKFEDLRDNNLAGYSPKEIDRPFKIIKHVRVFYKKDVWLPRFNDTIIGSVIPPECETYEKYGIKTVLIRNHDDMTELMQYKNSRLVIETNRAGHDPDTDRWAFRWGLNQLLHLISDKPEHKEFCLIWLEHLLENNLPVAEWASGIDVYNKPSLSKSPRDILIEAEISSESYPNISRLIAHKEEVDLWPDLLTRSLLGGDAANELSIGRMTKLRKLKLDSDGKTWEIVKSDKTLEHLRKSETEFKFIVSDSSLFPKNIVEISQTDEIYYCPKQNDKRKAWRIINDINKSKVSEIKLTECILGTDFPIEPDLDQAPNCFKYLDYLFRKIYSGKNIIWNPYCEPDSTKTINAGSGAIALKVGESDINIRAAKDDQLSTVEHNLLSEIIIDWMLENKITLETISDVVQMGGAQFPHEFYSRLNLENDELNQYQFIKQYCPAELNFEQLKQTLEAASSESELDTLLESLTSKYQNNDIELQNKSFVLKQWYDCVPSIITNRSSWTGVNSPNNPNSVNKFRQIGVRMCPQMELKGGGRSFRSELSGTIGNTLLVNVNESDWFGRFAVDYEGGEQYDFHPSAYDKLKAELLDKWFKTECDFITVEDIFINQDGDCKHGKFHKFHLIHIVASLSNYLVVD